MKPLFFILSFVTISVLGQVKDRYNYVQKPTHQSVTIAWRTAEPGTSVIRWGLDSLYFDDSLTSDNSTRKHVYTIKELAPNTTYYYQTETLGIFKSGIDHFSTTKLNQQNRFSFLHYGDCGYNNTIQNDIARLMQNETTDFAIVAGDVDQDKGDNYDEVFFGVYKDLLKNSCHYTCIGNHDTYADDAKTYLEEFYLPTNNPQQSERYYSFTWGNAKFICLDSNIPYLEGSDQYAWMLEELKCNNKHWLFVFFHHPPWTNAWSADYWIPFFEYFHYQGNKDMRTTLVPLFEKYKVDFVLNGHAHCYQRGEMNGVKYVISGGAGVSKLDKKRHSKSPNINKEVYRNQYVRFDVQGDTITYYGIDRDGIVFDSVKTVKSITKNSSILSQQEHQLVCNQKGKYEWFFDGLLIPEAKTNTITTDKPGFYEVMVTTENGCKLASEPLKVD